MAVPTDATEVFAIDTFGGTAPTPPAFISGFPVDFAIRYSTGTDSNYTQSRLTGETFLQTNSTSAEVSSSPRKFDYMDGYYDSTGTNTGLVSPMWKRAPNYFDVVVGVPQGSSYPYYFKHNLGVTPELVIQKRRDGTGSWYTMFKDGSNNWRSMQLQSTAAQTGNLGINSYMTDTQVHSLYSPPSDVVNYLFASLDGVSKVGSYTGTGAALNIDCGFSSGARFVMIKRADGTGSWEVWDTERGIVSGSEGLLRLNSTAAEITADWLDPYSSGFQVSALGPNAVGGTYIFYAIA
jgi:hypothetical protein